MGSRGTSIEEFDPRDVEEITKSQEGMILSLTSLAEVKDGQIEELELAVLRQEEKIDWMG